MKAHTSKAAFERLLKDAGKSVAALTVADGFASMFTFYRQHPAVDCPADSDGDMLLFQWGNDDRDGIELFELDLTRQFILDGDAEDENIWQLSLTFKFSPPDQLREIGSGNKWCPEPRPRTVDYFEGFVRGSAAYQAVIGLPLTQVELDFFNVG